MDRNQLDVMWQRALTAVVKDGEQFTRYHFAALVRNAALEEAAERCEQEITGAPFNTYGAFIALQETAAAIRSMKGKT